MWPWNLPLTRGPCSRTTQEQLHLSQEQRHLSQEQRHLKGDPEVEASVETSDVAKLPVPTTPATLVRLPCLDLLLAFVFYLVLGSPDCLRPSLRFGEA